LQNVLHNKKFHEQEIKAKDKVLDIINLVGLESRQDDLAKNITPFEQRKLMIAIAIAKNPKMLLLDEPAAGTTKKEQTQLIDLINTIRSSGVSVIVVEHHMHLIMNVCDRVIVFNQGNKIADDITEEIRNDSKVIEAYLC